MFLVTVSMTYWIWILRVGTELAGTLAEQTNSCDLGTALQGLSALVGAACCIKSLAAVLSKPTPTRCYIALLC